MSYKLGKSSLNNLKGVNNYLILLAYKTIQLSESDFGILNTGGLRDAEMQHSIFLAGNSKCDGYKNISYHQTGNAVDFVPYIDGKYTWNNKKAYIDIHVAFTEAERILRKEGIVPDNIYFHHGIYWRWKDLNKNGKLDISDKIGWDAAHHEIRHIPQNI